MEEGVVYQLADGSIQDCNKSAERILGLSLDQMKGRTSLDPRWRAVHEDGSSFPGETHPMIQTLKTGIPSKNVIMGIHHPAGELKWISINCKPIFNEGEDLPYAAIGTMSDITKQMQILTDLRIQKEQFNMMFSSMSEGFCVIEMLFDERGEPDDYRFLETNAVFESQTGLHKARGKRIREFAPEHESYWFEILGKVATTGEPAQFESEAKALNRWFSVNAYKIGGEESRELGILFNDITNLKAIDNSLRTANEELAFENKEKAARAIELTKLTHDLGERIKERTCLFLILRVVGSQNILLQEVQKQIVETLPPAWQYPEISCARLTIDHHESSTVNFKETRWGQSSDITVNGVRIGMVEVYYLEQKPELNEAPFLKEEYDLIDNIAMILGETIERRQSELELKVSKERFSELLENSPDAMIISQLSDGMIFFTNPVFTKLFKYTKKEAQGKTTTDLNLYAEPEDRKTLLKLLGEKENLINYETAFKAKNGDVYPCSLSVSVSNLNNEKILVTTIRDISELKTAELEKAKITSLYQQSLINTIKAIGTTVEKRDPYTSGHQNRVAQLSKAIARKLALSEGQIQGIELGATIHDIGKIYIPSEILNRPGKLSDPEFSMIKTHPEVGYEIIKDVVFPWPIAKMIRSHHERLDGSGYPQGLKGDEIIFEAQIIAVADVVEAVSSHRPYRPALGIEAGLKIIKEGKGNLYNPKIVDACVDVFKKEGFDFSSSF